MARRLEWQLGTVVEIRQETPKTKSLILDLPEWTTHLAGQHVDVRLTAEDGYQAQRSYSIASPPEDKHLMLTVERVEDGEVSPYLTDGLRVGDRVELRGPIGGYFVWDARDGKDDSSPLFLAAGGSGIAPLMSMIRHRASTGNKVPTRLLYSSRSYEEVIDSQKNWLKAMADVMDTDQADTRTDGRAPSRRGATSAARRALAKRDRQTPRRFPGRRPQVATPAR
jgi:ferredoxin-NADP reductase